MMNYLKHLVTAATAVSLPSASAIYDPDADPVQVGAEPGAVAFALALPEAEAAPVPTGASNGGAAANPMAPVDVAAPLAAAPLAAAPPPTGAGVAITTATTALPDPLLVGPTWAAVNYRSADAGGLMGVIEGSVVTFEIEEDGSFDGHAGCNRYFGTFEPGSFGSAAVAASALRSATSPTSSYAVDGRVGSTRMMCEGLMTQEYAYLANFQGTLNFSVKSGGEVMEMTDEAGVVAEFALYKPPILGQSWTATQYYSAEVESLVDVLPGSIVTLEMRVGEKLGGSAGCNQYNSAYDDLTTETFALAGPLIFTEKACDQPASVMEQESAYLKNFEGGRRRWAILDDGALELRDAESGAVVALFVRGADEGDTAFATLPASGGAALSIASAAVAAGTTFLLHF